ncbi:MAG: hypothetical protein HRT89_15605 [Lentisphaeria bacterium]|nr:hypothetical protein [Lentisphaeria bacterium]NQZ69483.1 hypothetical protein [Lentisphaeria bacterium]
MTDSTNPGPMVRIADLMHRALKLARRRWYVVLVLMIVIGILSYPFIKIHMAVARLKADNPHINEWGYCEIKPIDYPNEVDVEYIRLSEIGGLRELFSLKSIRIFSKPKLQFSSAKVSDISALKGMPFEILYLTNDKLSDMSALKGMPLKKLIMYENRVSDISALKGMPLGYLDLRSTTIADISALEGTPLKVLILPNSKITDISSLKGMPLNILNLHGASLLSKINVLKGMPLKYLYLSDTKIDDIKPLKGMSLERLRLNNTQVSDINALKGMPLAYLHLSKTNITDISVLKGMPLNKLSLPGAAKDIEFLKEMKTLKYINGKTPANFWKEYDRKKKLDK